MDVDGCAHHSLGAVILLTNRLHYKTIILRMVAELQGGSTLWSRSRDYVTLLCDLCRPEFLLKMFRTQILKILKNFRGRALDHRASF